MRYNVLWIDDDFKTQLDFIGEAEQENIDITSFESHEEGISHLNGKLDFFHAVILDAKVKKAKSDTVTGLSGLFASRDRLIEINNNSYLPYFIFTGQPDYLSSTMFKETVGDYYIKVEDNERLFKDLKEAIEKKEEYQIQKKYQLAFDVCTERYIGSDAQKTLLQILKNFDEPSINFNDGLYFTQIRIILESMFRAANKFGLNHDKCIVGGKVNLTESSLFMSGEATKYCEVKCNKQHFSKLISDGVKSILFITGAASHTADPDFINNLNFAEYRKSINTPYLLYSLTFQLMDILIWFKSYVDQNPDESINRLQWMSLKIVSEDAIWIRGTISDIALNGFGTFKSLCGKERLSVLPLKVRQLSLGINMNVEVTIKPNDTGTKTLIENIRIVL